ncbi:hypothetical protein [Devosia sp.]|uniref:hypothetical protein n=1 Tax=Devosia sp. TaxID=1871048 RepID=UPI003A95335D
MTSLLNTIKSSGRALVVAAALGGAAIAVAPAPAMAQSSPSFSFQLGIGNDGNGLSFGINNNRRHHSDRMRRCMNNRQVERGLRHYGFRDVEVIRKLRGSRVKVYGEYRRKAYTMKVNKCTGEVYDVERLRRGGRGGWDRFDDHRGHRDRWDDRNSGPRFEFRFGN